MKAAFTLLELILVITIIGILSSVLILNFNGIRQRQQLTLMADQALAMMQNARANVASGKVREAAEGEKIFLCEGAFFEVGEAPLHAFTDYDREAQACAFGALSEELYGLSTGEAFVDSILVGGVLVDEIFALHTPPDGDLIFYSATGDGQVYSGDGEVYFAHNGASDLLLSLKLSAQTGLASLTASQP